MFAQLKYFNMNHSISKPFFTAILFFIFFFSQAQQAFVFQENTGKKSLIIKSSSKSKIHLSTAIDQFELTNIQVERKIMQHLNYGLSIIPGKAGAPDLPSIVKNILIPNGASISVKILSSQKKVYKNMEIAPAAQIPFDTQDEIPPVKGIEYTQNKLYPAQTTQVRSTEIRGMNIAQIGIFPFQYNPINKELTVYKNMEIELEISNSKGSYGEDRFRSPFWDQILSDIVFNTEDIPKIKYHQANKNSNEEGCEYLIVIPNQADFLAWADTIRRFRNEQGIFTKVVTIDEIGGNDVDILDSYFEDVYNNWDPVPSAVLLMADYGNDETTITSKSRPHPYEGTYISDNDYADVTGNNLPDFVFARLTARNDDELELMVHKFTNYEKNPPSLASFYQNPITALGWQTERWFQLCTETIGGYMKNVLGKTPQRINAVYEGNPSVDPWSTASNTYAITSYFGPNGQNYIPATPSELGGWTGGTPNDVVDAINAGAFILQHRDHGNYSGWGEPGFSSNNIPSLHNSNLLTHVFSINCQTGQFNEGNNCFAEKFHRYDDGGALSVTAPTQVSYSFVNDAFVWGMYDNMWPDFLPDYGGDLIPERDFRPAFGAASGKYFLNSTSWASDGMKTITYRLFHNQGDAFGNVYTEIPMENTVAYESGITADITSIDVEALPHSLVGLSVDGNYLANGMTDENGTVTITFPPQDPMTTIKVVITKQNYFRNEGEILVVPAEGPYVIKTEASFDDENGNGMIEYNEDIALNFIIKNVGSELADNVSIQITSDDEYIEITDASEDIGSMEAGQEITVDQAFSFSVPLNIPDEHQINFTFSATNGSDVWESDFSLTAYAPKLDFSLISFTETNGNGNGYLDPGETATARFTAINNGHADFPAGLSTLTANSSYITIEATDQNFDALAMNDSLNMEFEITTSESTPTGTSASIINSITADPFILNKEMFFNIGLIVEDWESESFNSFPWQMSGDANWSLVSNYVSEGDFAVMTNDLDDDEVSSLELNYDVLGTNEISFFLQISSDENHDFLTFYIDDIPQASWSGLVLFEQFAFPLTEGEHNFKWEYAKDEEGHGGLDAAWLDFIILPPGNVITSTNDTKTKVIYAKIFPNPAKNQIHILSNIDEILYYQVINFQGQIIRTSHMKANEVIDITSYPSGIYSVKLQGKSGVQQIVQFIKL
jgi:hypothetical protein